MKLEILKPAEIKGKDYIAGEQVIVRKDVGERLIEQGYAIESLEERVVEEPENRVVEQPENRIRGFPEKRFGPQKFGR